MARLLPAGLPALRSRRDRCSRCPSTSGARRSSANLFRCRKKIAGDPSSGIGYFAAAGDGSFAFVPGTANAAESKLILTDRKGAVTELPLPPRQYRFPRFSPDGSTIAFSIGSGRGADDEVWTYQLSGGGLTRLTFSGGNFSPIWSGDGTRLAFVSARATNEGIYARSADGSGAEEWIYGDFTARLPSDWSRDGKTLLFTHPSNQVWLAALRGAWSSSSDSDKDSHMIEPSAYGGVFSPDDRWIAYAAAVSGAVAELFVQAADGSAAKFQLTTDGGGQPAWAGNEIFFVHSPSQVRVIKVETQPAFRASKPEPLFEGRYELRTAPLRNWDVSPDGKQFVFVAGGSDLGAKEVDVVLNWAQELDRIAGGARKMTLAGHPARPLRDPRAARRGRDGGGLPGAGHEAGARRWRSRCCPSVWRDGSRRARALRARGARRSRRSRTRTSSRSTTSGTHDGIAYAVIGAARGRDAARSASRRGRCPPRKAVEYARADRRRASPRPTRRGSSTAT